MYKPNIIYLDKINIIGEEVHKLEKIKKGFASFEIPGGSTQNLKLAAYLS